MALREGDVRMLAEIIRLHDEAFEQYQRCPDSMWKSSEGAVSVHFGNYWERDASPSVSVYSYALGPSRNHHFSNLPAALAEVSKWHREAFAHDCRKEGCL